MILLLLCWERRWWLIILHRSQTICSKLIGRSILLANLINDLIITALNLDLLLNWLTYQVARLILLIGIIDELVYYPVQMLTAMHWLRNHLRVHCIDFCYIWSFLVDINILHPINALLILKKTFDGLLLWCPRHKLNLYCSLLILVLIRIKLSKVIHNDGHFLGLL